MKQWKKRAKLTKRIKMFEDQSKHPQKHLQHKPGSMSGRKSG